jgi:hypothetical protein
MKWEKLWKTLSNKKSEGIIATVASILIILDIVTKKINFVIPVVNFLWRIIKEKVPIFYIVALILIVFILIKIRSRRLNEREKFIIGFLDEGERGIRLLFKAYKIKYPNESRTMSNCAIIVKQLEKKKLVKCEAFTGGINSIQDELFKLTKRGQKRFEKLDSKIKEDTARILGDISGASESPKPEKDKAKRIEPHEEVIFILNLIASVPNRTLSLRVLEVGFMNKFKKNELSELQIVLNDLKEEGFISEIGVGEWQEIGFEIGSEGLKYLKQNR